MKTDIWVVCFENSNNIGIHSKQLLYKAKSLVRKKEAKVSAICIGNYNINTLQSLSVYGADEVIYSREICMDYRYVTLILMEILKNENYRPGLIIFPSTDWGKCIATDFAVKIGAGLIAECIDIEIFKKTMEFTFTRAAINSTVLAQIKCMNTQVGICTCKENAFMISEKFPLRKIQIYELKNKIEKQLVQPHIMKSEFVSYEEKNIKLENAKLVFGIGRGIRDKNELNLIKEVAKKYDAALAGTRAIVEEGLLNKKWQVGQSGISISPDIYVAIGISGASQHIVGIKNAKKIIAINLDEKAPIFSYANFCIVEDFKNIFKYLL